ncbi:MAG: tetratricopeptide repeat protein, partial [Bacteroidales bacterium]|nr:tetratricopeptide repeat protein [Bacteroidales bacterium]
MKKLTVIFALLIIFKTLSAQKNDIDSLNNILDTTQSDSVKLINYLRLYEKLKFQHPDSVRTIYEEAINFAHKQQHKMTIAGLYNNRAISFGVYGINDSCINYLLKAVDIYKNIDTTLLQISYAYNNLASVYRNMGYYNLAVKYMTMALQKAEQMNDTAKIASRLNNLAATYHDMNDFENALKYARRARAIFTYLPVSYNKVNNLIAIGSIYSETGLLDSALYYNKLAEKIAQKINYVYALPDIYNNLGYIHEKKQEFTRADKNFLQSLNYCDSIKNLEYKFYPYWHLAEVARLQNRFVQAKVYLDKILDFADNTNNLEYKNKAYKEAYLFYKAKNKYKSALKYSELYRQWADSVMNNKKQKQIAEMNIIYETAKKEQKIKLQEKQNQIQKAEIERQRMIIWLIVMVSVILLIAVLAFIVYRTQKQKQEILKLKIEAQENIKKEIAGELHSGVGSKLTATILQLENKLGSTPEIENIKAIYRSIRTASHLLALPDFVLSTIEDEINNMVTNFKTDTLEIETGIYSKNGWKDVSPFIQQNIYRIVQELFTNSFKHSGATNISMQLIRHKEYINLTYEDNGK